MISGLDSVKARTWTVFFRLDFLLHIVITASQLPCFEVVIIIVYLTASEKKGSIGDISVVLGPIWLKFWPKVGLASLLDCYSMKKSGYMLKKRSFCHFPSLVEIREIFEGVSTGEDGTLGTCFCAP